MLRITGDTHRTIGRFVKGNPNFIHDTTWGEDDVLIVAGDFGFVLLDTPEEHDWLDWLERTKPYTIAFVDGNHENHPRIAEYPEEIWNGGRINRLRKNIIHLMRGQVYRIDGKKIFSFGGARSHDISGGILEPEDPDYKIKKKQLDKGWEPYRINHVSWWEQEMPTAEEMKEGRRNLKEHRNCVDFIVTHCCSSGTQACLGGGMFTPDELTKYFQELRETVQFKKWFFGHYHDNKNVNAEEILLYEQIIRIA